MPDGNRHYDNRTTDTARDFDQAMATALELCLKPDIRYLSVTLSVPKSFNPNHDRQALIESLEWHTERLSRKAKRRPRDQWLQAVYVLESPERKRAVSREISGDYHRHIHGMLEVPEGVDFVEFTGQVARKWQDTAFYTPCNNTFNPAPDPKGWLGYINKLGSRDPKTNRSVPNELLFECFRPIAPSATVSLPDCNAT